MTPHPPGPPPFPYTTLFRSVLIDLRATFIDDAGHFIALHAWLLWSVRIQSLTCQNVGEVLPGSVDPRSEEHTSELQSQSNLVCRLLLEKKKNASERSTRAAL